MFVDQQWLSQPTILDLGGEHLYSMSHETLMYAHSQPFAPRLSMPPIGDPATLTNLQESVQRNRQQRKIDTYKELELLRHYRVTGMADHTYFPLLGLTISQAFDRWNQKGQWSDTPVDENERETSKSHICAVLYDLCKYMNQQEGIEFLGRAVLSSLSSRDRKDILSELIAYTQDESV